MSGRGQRALGWTLALLAMAGFARLGVWQLDRMHQKQAMLDATATVLRERRALPLERAGDPARARAYDWAAGTGHFLAAPPVLLDNQSRAERIGIKAYRAFQPDAGGTPLLVDLGWLPLPGDRRMPDVPRPPGRIALAGLLAPPPSGGLFARAPAYREGGHLVAMAIDPAALARALGLRDLAPRVLRLDPAAPIGYARDLDVLPNTLTPERHLGYAVQWFGLALAVLATALVLTFRKPRRGGSRHV